MRRTAIVLPGLLLIGSVAAGPASKPAVTPAADAGQVSIGLVYDRLQPAGMPIIVRLKLTNTGFKPISWWCGGPDVYPAAQHFAVTVYDNPDRTGRPAPASNGQYIEGSGTSRSLAAAASIDVPLAIPTRATDGVRFSITTAEGRPDSWRTDKSAEGFVLFAAGAPGLGDRRRADVIAAVSAGASPFMAHVAEHYPDPVVVDAMLRLVGVDDPLTVTRAAQVLARQPTLPASAGDNLAALVRRWLPRSPAPDWGGLREYLTTAALLTQSESARAAVLQMMADLHEGNGRWVAMNALRLSPGDTAWLRRARAATVAVGRADPDGAELAREVGLLTAWLDSRLAHPTR